MKARNVWTKLTLLATQKGLNIISEVKNNISNLKYTSLNADFNYFLIAVDWSVVALLKFHY
jgi:hypothetical protein